MNNKEIDKFKFCKDRNFEFVGAIDEDCEVKENKKQYLGC